MAERQFKRNSTSKKSATVNTLNCRKPSNNIYHRGQIAENCLYEGWNFNSGNTAVETPCNGTK